MLSPLLRLRLFARRRLRLFPAPAGHFDFSSPSASLFCTPVPLAVSRSGGAFAFSSPSASLFCTPVPLAISRSGGAFRLLLSSVSAFLHAGASGCFPLRRGFSSSTLLRICLFARRCLHLFPAPAGLFDFSSPSAPSFCTPAPLAVSRSGGAFRLLLPFGPSFLHAGASGCFPPRRGFCFLLSFGFAFLHAGGSVCFPPRRGFSSSPLLRPLLFARRCLHLFPAPAGLLLSPLLRPLLFARRRLHLFPAPAGLFVFSSPSAPPFCTPVPPSVSRSGGAFRLLLSFGPSFLHAGASFCFRPGGAF